MHNILPNFSFQNTSLRLLKMLLEILNQKGSLFFELKNKFQMIL